MSPTVAYDATKRDRAPGWRPGPKGSPVVGVQYTSLRLSPPAGLPVEADYPRSAYDPDPDESDSTVTR